MKRILIMLTVLMSATGILAQQTETIELPLSLYNQTTWQAKETTVTLNSEEEELPAYELQGWQTYQGMSRQGTVYYVPSALNDRIILMLKDVNSGFVRLPALIDNKTDQGLAMLEKLFDNASSLERKNQIGTELAYAFITKAKDVDKAKHVVDELKKANSGKVPDGLKKLDEDLRGLL